MEQAVTCSKCNTINSADAVKCSNCGFPFSRVKMEKMEKFMENIHHKTTTLDSSIQHTPNNPLESDITFVSKNPNQGVFQKYIDDNAENSELEEGSEKFDNSELPAGNQEFSQSNWSGEFTPLMVEEQAIQGNQEIIQTSENKNIQISEESGSCKKCGYILSDFSSLCPDCGHNNISVSVTVRMPEETQTIEEGSQFLAQTEGLGQNITGSYPEMRNKTEKYNLKRNLPVEGNKTISQQDQREISPLNAGSNVTIREEISHLSKYTLPPEDIQEPKSKTRLEAIYLGQDSDQKMLINIPEDQTSLSLNRAMIDLGDSTISSEDHAVIYKEGNSWKIRNKASNKAVFIQVNDVSTLIDGDIIMLGGDKFYLFKDDSRE